jgi:hypothetical protein
VAGLRSNVRVNWIVAIVVAGDEVPTILSSVCLAITTGPVSKSKLLAEAERLP